MKLQKFYHFIHVSLTHKKFFLDVMGGPALSPHSVAVPTCWWELHLRGALLPVQDTGGSTKLCLLPLPDFQNADTLLGEVLKSPHNGEMI